MTVLRVLAETVMDTDSVCSVMREFEEAMGLRVEVETVHYLRMWDRLRTSLLTPRGVFDVVQVDVAWTHAVRSKLRSLPQDMDPRGRVNPKFVSDEAFRTLVPDYHYGMGILYNKGVLRNERFRQALSSALGGVPGAPRTLDEYVRLCKAASRAGAPLGVCGTCCVGEPVENVFDWFNFYIAAHGGVSDGEQFLAQLVSPPSVEATSVWVDLLRSGPDEDLFRPYEAMLRWFEDGKVFLVPSFVWLKTLWGRQRLDVDFWPMPGGGFLGFWNWAVPWNAPHPAEAEGLVRWITSATSCAARLPHGHTPVLLELYKDPWKQQHPVLSDYELTIERGHPLPSILQHPQAIGLVSEGLIQCVAGRDVREALSWVAGELRMLIGRHNAWQGASSWLGG